MHSETNLLISTYCNNKVDPISCFSNEGMLVRRKRCSPLKEAEYYIERDIDRDGLRKEFISPTIGEL